MRIVLTVDSFLPAISGVTVYLSKVAGYLVAQGHEVLILAASTDGPFTEETYQGARVARLRSIVSPFKKSVRYVVGQQFMVNRLLREFQPDIIHVHDLGGSSSAAVRYGRRKHLPVIGTRHFATNLVAPYIPFGNLLSEETLHNLIDLYAHEFFALCTVVTVPTETVRTYMLKTGFKGEVVVISNGVDIPKRLKREPVEPPVLLTVSRIDADKNLPLLLKTIPLVLAKYPNVQFVIVGDGTELAACRQYVNRHGLQEHVTFTGLLDPASGELERWYQRATLLVVPSLVETQSIVTLEAMAQGLPVVAVEAMALPELVRDGETGYGVAQPVPQAMAAAITQALDNPQERERRGRAGRVLVEREHERDMCLERLVRLYETLIRRG